MNGLVIEKHQKRTKLMKQIEIFELLRRIEQWNHPHGYQSMSFRQGENWLRTNKKYPVIVFYNTGKHLFV